MTDFGEQQQRKSLQFLVAFFLSFPIPVPTIRPRTTKRTHNSA
jgi:hypothetical protein